MADGSPQIDLERKVVAERLCRWVEGLDPEPCVVEYRFKHGNEEHSCWVATSEGKKILADILCRLNSETQARNKEAGFFSITRALFKEAYEQKLDEDNSVLWITGKDTTNRSSNESTDSGDPIADWTWNEIKPSCQWEYSRGKSFDQTNGSDIPSIEESRVVHETALQHTSYTYLFTAIPKEAVRTSGELKDIVVLQAIWDRLLNNGDTEQRKRIREAASHLLIWTTARITDQHELARVHFNKAYSTAHHLFDESDLPHNPHEWTQEQIKTNHDRLQSITSDYENCIKHLRRSHESLQHQILIRCEEGNSPCSHLWIAKAISHHRIHFYTLKMLFPGLTNSNTSDLDEWRITLPNVEMENEKSLNLLRGFASLCREESKKICQASFHKERGAVGIFSIVLELTGSPLTLITALLEGRKDANERGMTHKTSRAIARIRECANAVYFDTNCALEPEPTYKTLTIKFEFKLEVLPKE